MTIKGHRTYETNESHRNHTNHKEKEKRSKKERETDCDDDIASHPGNTYDLLRGSDLLDHVGPLSTTITTSGFLALPPFDEQCERSESQSLKH